MTYTTNQAEATDEEVREAAVTMAALRAQARDPEQENPSTEDYESACLPLPVLRRILKLEPGGVRIWLPRTGAMMPGGQPAADRFNAQFAGKPALTAVDNRGYEHGVIFGRNFRASRAVFALHHGRWPVGQVDHRDGNKLNNDPANLREVPESINMGNKTLYSNNSSGFQGVRFRTDSGKYRARIQVGGTRVFTRCGFSFFDDAVDALLDEAYNLTTTGQADFHPGHYQDEEARQLAEELFSQHDPVEQWGMFGIAIPPEANPEPARAARAKRGIPERPQREIWYPPGHPQRGVRRT